jgi:hypothetical protein
VAQVDFEIIYLVDRGKTYTFIVERPWGGWIRIAIPLEKKRTKLKDEFKKFIIPLNLAKWQPWSETREYWIDRGTVIFFYHLTHDIVL